MKAIAPLQVVRTLRVRFLFSIDEDVIRFDPAIGRKNNWAVAKAAFGLHPFGEIDLPVNVGYLISVSPTVSQHVKYNKTKELAERVGLCSAQFQKSQQQWKNRSIPLQSQILLGLLP
jgi:hypothetical protein